MPLSKDDSYSAIDAAVNEVKRSIDLDEESQSPDFSGNESAPDAGGPEASAAKPSGSPGTSDSDVGPGESFGPDDRDY